MAMIGRGAAIAEVGKRHHEIHGELAHMAWLGVHAALMTGTRAKIEAFVDWAWDGFTKTGGPHVLDRGDAAEIDWDDDDLVATAPAGGVARGTSASEDFVHHPGGARSRPVPQPRGTTCQVPARTLDPLSLRVADRRVARVEVQRMAIEHHLVQVSLHPAQDRDLSGHRGRLRHGDVGSSHLHRWPQRQALTRDALQMRQALAAQFVDRVAAAVDDDRHLLARDGSLRDPERAHDSGDRRARRGKHGRADDSHYQRANPTRRHVLRHAIPPLSCQPTPEGYSAPAVRDEADWTSAAAGFRLAPCGVDSEGSELVSHVAGIRVVSRG